MDNGIGTEWRIDSKVIDEGSDIGTDRLGKSYGGDMELSMAIHHVGITTFLSR